MSRTSSAAPDLRNRPAPGPAFTDLIELRDFMRVHLSRLTAKQRSTVVAWSEGRTCIELAILEGVTEEAVHARLNAGLNRLRELAKGMQ